MKKYKELLLGLLVIVAGVLYWIFGYDKPEPIDRPEPAAKRIRETQPFAGGDAVERCLE